MSDPQDVEAIVASIRPLLNGQPMEVQGAVLADLLATFLAGHVVIGDPEETRALRAGLLDLHIRLVRDLIELNAQAMGTNK